MRLAWCHLLFAAFGALYSGIQLQTPTTPCDWFDQEGDGLIGGNSWLHALGN